ncbi:tRNA-uridine aminocarboxypropyltransferase [Marinomonas sp. THO17]|uniref:tRNA-uridine aminocarboxypropyltransferase n=1 Tax=Marinomonas sp. THO17 TaxID=3149048 RepID=UPI00336BCC94
MMKVWLVTHSEELKKSTGTGRLVKSALKEECEIIEWSRVEPNPTLLALDPQQTILVYPNQGKQIVNLENDAYIKNIILIDGTWQQAKKMYNHSPYLQHFSHLTIEGIQSTYRKRRNQKSTGLCTAESVIYLLEKFKHPAKISLQTMYDNFNQ